MNRWSPEIVRERVVKKVRNAAVRKLTKAAQEEHAARFRPFKPIPSYRTFLRCVLAEEIALTVGVSPDIIGKARTRGRRKAEVELPNIAPRFRPSR